MKHIVGFSGGIDSQAVARWVLNRYPKEDVVIVNTDAGGNEHPLTVEFVNWYSANIHQVNTIRAIVADMWIGEDQPEKHGYRRDEILTFQIMAKIKGRFPSRMAQFCTEILKLRPVRRWVNEQFPDGDYEYYSGVRRDESERRKNTLPREWNDYFDSYCNHPIMDWTKEMCFIYVKAHGERVNPLYTFGFNRVGCAPCVNSGKDDILNWARRFPEMIDKVREWEKLTGRTFFSPMIPKAKDGGFNTVDEVVEWSKTARGGKQLDMVRTNRELPACESNYGLCE